ncbi:MAG: hypothetical protein DCC55_31290 [Chloroflexi bacterium]|nr:MAG: hypothetical protein DCC55_31290 [Chloroflexota bacterium]
MQFAPQNHNLNEKRGQSAKLFPDGAASRRRFLIRMARFGAASLFLPGLLAACGNTNTSSGTSSGAVAQGAVAAPCAESENLSRTEVATRKAVAYVDESPHAGKTCANCRFFKQPAAGANCGGCEIAGGPIAPGGYCNAWAAQ